MNRRTWLRLSENFFRRPWRNMLPLLIMIAFGAIYLYLRGPVYLSRGIFYIQEESLLNSLTNVRSNSVSRMTPAKATKARIDELLQTDAFVRAIIARSDLEPLITNDEALIEVIEVVREDVWAQIQGETQVAIVARADSPQLAYQLAGGTVESFLLWQINSALEEGINAEAFYSDLVDQYQHEFDQTQEELEAYLLAHPEPIKGKRPMLEQVQIAELQSQVDMAAARFNTTEKVAETARLRRIQTERTVRQRYLLVDQPQLPVTSQNSIFQSAMIFLSFTMVGTLLTLVTTIGNALVDHSFLFPVDVREELELPLLGLTSHATIRIPPPAFAIDKQLTPQEQPRINGKLAVAADPPTVIITSQEAV